MIKSCSLSLYRMLLRQMPPVIRPLLRGRRARRQHSNQMKGLPSQDLGLPPKLALRGAYRRAPQDSPALLKTAASRVTMDVFQRLLFTPQNVAAARCLRCGTPTRANRLAVFRLLLSAIFECGLLAIKSKHLLFLALALALAFLLLARGGVIGFGIKYSDLYVASYLSLPLRREEIRMTFGLGASVP